MKIEYWPKGGLRTISFSMRISLILYVISFTLFAWVFFGSLTMQAVAVGATFGSLADLLNEIRKNLILLQTDKKEENGITT